MTIDEPLGKYLSDCRIKRGLSIKEVAATTRINEKFIRFVESDHFDKLPGDVFTKGFLRTYAQQLGIDGDELVIRYGELNIEHQDRAPQMISIPLRPGSSRIPFVAVIMMLLGVASAVYYYYAVNSIAPARRAAGHNERKVKPEKPAKRKPEPGKIKAIMPEPKAKAKPEKQKTESKQILVKQKTKPAKVRAAGRVKAPFKPNETISVKKETSTPQTRPEPVRQPEPEQQERRLEQANNEGDEVDSL